MIIGVMSDSHGNLDYMQRAANFMVREFAVKAIIHLGDDYDDALKLDAKGVPLYAVPGMFEKTWRDDRVPHRLIKEFGGIVFLLSHTPTKDKHDKSGDLNPEKAFTKYGAEVLLHGHTHKYQCLQLNDGLVVICPGHVKGAMDRDAPPTFAIVDALRPIVGVKFVGMDGLVIEEANARVASAAEFDAMEPTITEEPIDDV
jgi:putative phosphoesterase